MYATIVHCELHNCTSAFAHGHTGRTLTAALAALPGFVAFVALEMDTGEGTVTAVCLMEERTGLAAAEAVIARWQGEQSATVGTGVRRGEVIMQQGL